MDLLFEATIAVQSHCVKKNSKQIMLNRSTRRPFIASNPKTLMLENALIHQLMIHKSRQAMKFPIQEPICLALIFYYKKNANGKPTKKIADLSNLIQGPEDALQKAGIIANDKLVESFDGTRRVTDADETKIQIKIFRFTKT